MILNGRSRKSKCDGSLPCSSCTLRGTSDTCSFPHPTRSEVPSRRLEGALKRRRDDQDISTPRDDRLDSVRLHLGRALLSIGETVGATLVSDDLLLPFVTPLLTTSFDRPSHIITMFDLTK